MNIKNSIFGYVNYNNTDDTSKLPLFAAAIKMHKTADKLEIDNTLFTQQHTSINFTNTSTSFLDSSLYCGGCILIGMIIVLLIL